MDNTAASETKYLYADILIALASIDDNVDDREKELLDGFFANMDLDPDRVAKMWLTPRTPDVVAAILKDVQDETFKRSLLKDCYLLAYADDEIDAEESRFLKEVTAAMDLDSGVAKDVRNWVETAVEQQKKAAELFGEG